MTDNSDENPTDNSSPTEIADSSADGEVQDQIKIPSNEESGANQFEEEFNRFREIIAATVAATHKQASEISVLADHLREMEVESQERLVSIQTAQSNAVTVVDNITSTASEVKELPSQLSQLKDEIVLLHGTATKNAEEIAATHMEIERLQSDVAANATAVSQHKQTALTEANVATAQKDAAISAAGSTAKNQADSLAALTQVQGHLNQAETLKKQISDVLESAKEELAGTKEASISAKQFLDVVKKDSDLAEAAKQTALAATQRVASEEKSIKEASNRIVTLEQTIKTTNADMEACRKQYSELVKMIEGLLPGATSAGLASAFREQKQSYDRPKIGYIALFVLSALLLAFVQPLVPEEAWMTKLTNPWEIMLAHMLQKSPVEVPLLLMLYFSFRAFTTADKLQQDYAYKERIATTFEGFKSQFANIETPTGTESPLGVLCIKLLTIIGQHPARFYDPKHVEDLPSGPQAAKQVQGLFSQSRSTANADIETESSIPTEAADIAKLDANI